MTQPEEHSQNINTVVRRHLGFVHALAVKYSPAPGLAHDVTQQVFLEFLKKREHWDLERDVRPLLAEMTRIVARRLWQRTCRQMNREMRGLAEHVRRLAENRDLTPYLEEERAALRHCLEKLPERSRRLVRARYYLGANATEIARQLDMKAPAVRRALARLREKLRACVGLRLGQVEA